MEQDLVAPSITAENPLSEFQYSILMDLQKRISHYLVLETRWLEDATGMLLETVSMENHHNLGVAFNSSIKLHVTNPPQQ